MKTKQANSKKTSDTGSGTRPVSNPPVKAAVETSTPLKRGASKAKSSEAGKSKTGYTIDDLVVDLRFDLLPNVDRGNPQDETHIGEKRAYAKLVESDGEIYDPILYCELDGVPTLVSNHRGYRQAMANRRICHTLRQLHCETWQDAMIWVAKYIAAIPTVSIWQKLKVAFTARPHLEARAKFNQRKGCSENEQTHVRKIIADMIGRSPTFVYYYECIQNDTKLVARCGKYYDEDDKKGGLSISAAYEIWLKNQEKTKKPGKQKESPKKLDERPKFTFTDKDVFQLAEPVDTSNLPEQVVQDVASINPKNVCDKVLRTIEADPGDVFFISYPEKGVIMVFHKDADSKENLAHFNVNTYLCWEVQPGKFDKLTEDGHIKVLHGKKIYTDEKMRILNEDDFDSANISSSMAKELEKVRLRDKGEVA